MKTSSVSTPTIKNLLASMPPEGTESHESRLQTYATLGHYYNGINYQDASVRVIKSLITNMDAQAILSFDPAQCVQIEDEINDRYGFSIGDDQYWFQSPSISKMPKRGTNLAKFYRDCIDQLAEDPSGILSLPYLAFSPISECLGKCLGLS